MQAAREQSNKDGKFGYKLKENPDDSSGDEEDEAKVVFRNAAFSGTHVVKDDAEGAAPVVAFKKRAVKPKGKRNSRRKTDDA
jgi:hypothetical protein